ncbi:hypothetical protein Tco_0975814 [Tanacetum coccineum]|uniref:Uncharacterized protein n=1 Tax=Tanacetum coccineum TaxID=301880 RepID=A0ABQ5EFS7_9ASTR
MSSANVFCHVLDECLKHIVSDVEKNLKNPRQAARGVQVGPNVAFKPIKQVYRHDSDRNNASSSGKKKQHAVAGKKSAGKGPNSDMFSSDHGFLNVASSSTSTTPIVERIDKIERQIIDGKFTLVDDNGQPLPKVVSTTNKHSDSEVENVLVETMEDNKHDDDYDPYDDDLYENQDMSENLQVI